MQLLQTYRKRYEFHNIFYKIHSLFVKFNFFFIKIYLYLLSMFICIGRTFYYIFLSPSAFWVPSETYVISRIIMSIFEKKQTTILKSFNSLEVLHITHYQ